MLMLLTCLVMQLNTQYKSFVQSPRSEVIFNGLIRGEYQLEDFADDPVVLWFWRSNTGSPQADSLLETLALPRNFYWSAVLRWEAAETNDNDMAYNKLRLATHLDSMAVENFISLIALGISTRNFHTIQSAFSLPVLNDFRSQIFFIVNLTILVLLALYMSTITYVLVKVVYYLPVLSHRIRPKKHQQLYDLIKALVLLVPVIIFRNLYLIFIAYAILLTLVFTLRERNWFRVLLISIMAVFVLFFPVNNFVAFLTGYTKGYQLYEIVNHDSAIIPEAQTPKEREILAYGLKTQGYHEKAISLYNELYYGGTKTPAIINNLANLYFLQGEKAKAESLYHFSLLYEDRGEPYFNLGLLKLKDIEYIESTRYMEEARKRNFSSLSKDPVDIKPTNNDFYRMLFSEDLKMEGIIKNAFMIPIILIFVLTFLPIRLKPPFYCSSCARPVCPDCLKEINDEILCNDCFSKFKTTKRPEIEEELRRAVNRNRRRIKTIIIVVINVIIPGSGLIYLGKHLIGLILVFLTMLGYIPMFFSHMFIRPAGWIALSEMPIMQVIAAVIVIICYIVSFMLIREHYAD
jgi:tetratricopeptide (TPR) repeat protein